MAATADRAGNTASRSQHADLTGNNIASNNAGSGRIGTTPSTSTSAADPATPAATCHLRHDDASNASMRHQTQPTRMQHRGARRNTGPESLTPRRVQPIRARIRTRSRKPFPLLHNDRRMCRMMHQTQHRSFWSHDAWACRKPCILTSTFSPDLARAGLRTCSRNQRRGMWPSDCQTRAARGASLPAPRRWALYVA